MAEERTVVEAIEAFLAHRRAKRLSERTLSLYGGWLRTWQTWRAGALAPAALAGVAIEELRGFFRYVAEEHVPHSANPQRPAAKERGYSAHAQASCWGLLRALWRFCAGEDWLTPVQLRYFANGRLPRPRVEEPIRPYIDRPLLDQLVAAAGEAHDEEAARNRAILLLLYETGLRISELCSLTDDAVQLDQHRAQVCGKGAHHAYVFWGRAAHQALRQYLRVRRGAVGGDLALFRGMNSRNRGGAITADAVRAMVQRVAARAGVALPHGAPVHSLRHGYAHALLDAKIDALHVQQLLRHKDRKSTERYTREHPDRLQDIHGDAFD